MDVKERRNQLFQYLDGVLDRAEKKAKNGKKKRRKIGVESHYHSSDLNLWQTVGH